MQKTTRLIAGTPKAMITKAETEKLNVTVLKNIMDETMGNQQPSIQGNLDEGSETRESKLSNKSQFMASCVSEFYTENSRNGIKVTAQKFGISRKLVKKILISEGVAIRDLSESHKCFMMSEEDKLSRSVANKGNPKCAEAARRTRNRLGTKTRPEAYGNICNALSRRTNSQRYNGGFYHRITGGRVYYRSSWEQQVMQRLDSLKLNWLYESFTIPYTKLNGNRGHCKPDFLIEGKLLLEVKADWERAFPKQILKLNISERFALDNGLSFVVLGGSYFLRQKYLNQEAFDSVISQNLHECLAPTNMIRVG